MSMDYGPFSIQVSMYYCLSLLPNQAKEKSFISSLMAFQLCKADPKLIWTLEQKNKMVVSSLKYRFSSFEKVSTWHQINDRVLSKKLTELLMNWKIP